MTTLVGSDCTSSNVATKSFMIDRCSTIPKLHAFASALKADWIAA